MATARPALEWQPITPRFGAQLTNRQLHEFDDQAASALAQLVAERGVVVCREQRTHATSRLLTSAAVWNLARVSVPISATCAVGLNQDARQYLTEEQPRKTTRC